MNGKGTRVVGVISDVRESSLETQPGWQMYLPSTQDGPEGAELVVRTKLPPDALASSVMSVLRSINPGQPATEFRTIQTLVDRAVSPRRFFVLLVSLFAALGLILASLGIYGVISYSVSRQTQEIGIRMALGATANRVQLAVINKTLRSRSQASPSAPSHPSSSPRLSPHSSSPPIPTTRRPSPPPSCFSP